jgi:hypothetical protein
MNGWGSESGNVFDVGVLYRQKAEVLHHQKATGTGVKSMVRSLCGGQKTEHQSLSVQVPRVIPSTGLFPDHRLDALITAVAVTIVLGACMARSRRFMYQ